VSDEEPIFSTRMGHCASCWNKGMPPTLVSAPPMGRCVDRAACEIRRHKNATGVHLVTKTATVETVRRNRVHYFRTVRKYAKNDKGEDVLVREDLELVPDRKDATKYPPKTANLLARVWNALAREI
jgi:hypothetical protein